MEHAGGSRFGRTISGWIFPRFVFNQVHKRVIRRRPAAIQGSSGRLTAMRIAADFGRAYASSSPTASCCVHAQIAL